MKLTLALALIVLTFSAYAAIGCLPENCCLDLLCKGSASSTFQKMP